LIYFLVIQRFTFLSKLQRGQFTGEKLAADCNIQ